MKMQATYSGWGFTNVWYLDASINQGYPVPRCDRRFEIPAAGTTPATPLPPSDGIRVLVNGKEVVFDQPPVVVNDRTMVPLRAIFEALNATVEWHGEDQSILDYRGNTAVKLQLDVAIMAKQVSGGAIQLITLDAVPFAQNNRTLVPGRAIEEDLDCEVGWDGATQTVTVDG